MYIIDDTNVAPLLKAYTRFREFFVTARTELEQTAVVKAFEYTYELSWKTMKRLLRYRGIESKSPRETFREAARIGLIHDPEVWFGFLEKRNLTAHTYQETQLAEIMAVCPQFLTEVEAFLNTLGIDDAAHRT